MTAWTENDEVLASGYEQIDVIDWKKDSIIIHYKNHVPPSAVNSFLISKDGQGEENKHCYLVDQYFIPIKDALNLQLRYMFFC